MSHDGIAARRLRSSRSSQNRTALALMGHPQPAGAAPPRASSTETQYDLEPPRCQDKAHSGAGDELQGMKRGIIEMLDGMAINKADGDNKPKAERARIEYSGALHLFPASADGWTPRVLTCSSVAKEGIAEVWRMVLDHRELLEGNGFLAQLRNLQALQWMNELTMLGLEELFRRDRAVAERLPLLREEVHGGRMTPFAAARQLLALFHPQPTDDPSRKETL